MLAVSIFDVKKRFLKIAPAYQSTWPTLVVLGLLILARLLGLFQGLELKTFDLLLRLRPPEAPDERILIVGVDDTDIQQVGTYPIPDAVMADMLQKLDQHQPRVIGIDFYRDLPVEPGHQRWLDTLATTPNVIVIEKVLDMPISPPPTLPAERAGFVDLPLDGDGFVRRITLGMFADDGSYHFAFSLRLAEQYLAAEGLPLENGVQNPAAMRFGETEFSWLQPNSGGYVDANLSANQILLNPRSGQSFRTVSLRQVLGDGVDPDWIRGAIVIVGNTSLGVKDVVNSATIASENPGLVNGVEIHAHATSQLVSAVLDDRSRLRTWPDSLEYGWIIAWGLIGGGVALAVQRVSRSLMWGGLLFSLLWVTGIGLSWLAMWVPLLVPAIAFVMTNTVTTSWRLAQLQKQQQMTMRLLGQQTSPEIAEALWNERKQLLKAGKLLPQELTVTILFSDIRAFTRRSEQQSPKQVMSWLNDYFVAMTEEVQRHHGVVNKFIGDGLMAVFGVPIARTSPRAVTEDAQQAVNCALAMEQRIIALNKTWQAQGMDPIQVRVGIFTGPAIVGSLGGQQRLEYAVIGDSVNTASRLESCDKIRQTTACRILIAQETLQHLDPRFIYQSWGNVALRGKQQPVQVYQVLGKTAPCLHRPIEDSA